MNEGLPFTGFTPSERERIRIVVSDVDDTVTKNGKLFPDVLNAMWRVKASGRTIVLVTGGSAGWADAYLRQWPVDAVVAESGALMVCHGRDGDVIHIVNPVIDKEGVQRKRKNLLEKTAGLPLSSDQCARVFDIAYDKKHMDALETKALRATLSLYGASWAESSIHVNAWFGDYDKRKGSAFFLTAPFGVKEEYLLEHGIYLGDSFNDQSMFSYFPLSIGMHSVEEQREGFSVLPTYITEEGSGDGWVRFARSLLEED